MFDPLRILYGLILSGIIGGLAYWRGSLTASGWLGAVITGTCTFGFGGLSWGLILITFFVSSSLLSHYKQRLKSQRVGDTFAKGSRRDLAQALANGGIASFIALLYAILYQPSVLYAAYVGVLATVTADTWATELGVLSKAMPRLVTSGRIVAPGTSGGITLFGTSAAATGGFAIGLAALLFDALNQWLGGVSLSPSWWLPLIGLISGLGGALIDSLLGATIQAMYRSSDGKQTERRIGADGKPNAVLRGWGWMNNDLVNLISSVGGSVIAVALFLVSAL